MSYIVPDAIPKENFRTYDIRGEAGGQGITPDVAYAIGLSIGSEAREQALPSIFVGRDGRLTGPALKEALVEGLLSTGIDVIDLGEVPTPLVYFATNRLSTNSGVMVTASHNPASHNGFKMVLNGKTVSTEGVQSIYHRIIERRFVTGKGSLSEYDIVPEYLKFITEQIHLKKRLKVVVDCGNGIAGKIAPDLYRQLGCDVIELFCEVDGRFPNHHPDPTVPANLKDIIETVKREKADIGLAFDGDADRLGVVTDQGEIIWPDRQLILFSQDVLSRNPGGKIVFDVKCTNLLPKSIVQSGGQPIMYRTGHSVLKAKMFEESAVLAGEMSGHIFFRENWFGFDDGLYVGARLLAILSEDKRTVSEIFGALPNSFNTPELKLPMEESAKPAFMKRLIEAASFSDAKRITIDGLRLEYPDGWALIRPSNTSPYLILRFEGDTRDGLDRIQREIKTVLLGLDSTLKLPF